MSSLGRWTTGLNSLTGDSLEVTVECNQGKQASKETTNQETGEMANVMNQIIKVEDFDITENEQDTKACEQILDKFLEFSSASMENAESSSTNTSNENNILDTAWEETFGDLFPDLDLEYC